MGLLANSNAISSGGYPIQRSLRFRSSASAYLSRTPASAGNRKTWTWSGWVKRGSFKYCLLFAAGNTNDIWNSVSTTQIAWGASTDALSIYDNGTYLRTTSQVFRDPSAWYHLIVAIDTTQATAANRVKLYVNGSEVTAFATSNNPTLNADLFVNAAYNHVTGGQQTSVANAYFDGYLAEVNFIDGQALTPSSFGYTEPVTGVWQPLKYAGTYGTNGFYLPFTDTTSATTLAYDKSGNGNNWTPNNISTTAGATYDSMTDVPTLTSATAANYCVLNPLIGETPKLTLSNGNLTATKSSTTEYSFSSIIVSTGKWYAEAYVTTTTNVASTSISVAESANGNTTLGGYRKNGGTYGLTGSPTFATYTNGDIIGVAFDCDNKTVAFYKNGTVQGTGQYAYSGTDPISLRVSIGTDDSAGAWNVNFGQRPFSYTPPNGFVALNTFNLPDPTIKKPNQYMDATTYTGNGSTQTITNAGGFQPDFVWCKSRAASADHGLYDSVRGVNKILISDGTFAESNLSPYGLTSFNSNGFSVSDVSNGANGINGAPGGLYSGSSAAYVGWQWKKGATPGFDIVTFTSDGSSLQTVSHSLGVSPAMIIVKSRSATGNWSTYQKNLTSTNYYLNLNTTAAQTNLGAQAWGVSASNFQINSINLVGSNGTTAVAYLFAEIPGFSKFGSYTGNGSADGPFVFTGFQPKYVLIKSSSGVEDWCVLDGVRAPYNVNGTVLRPNLFNAEFTDTSPTNGVLIDMNANGFKIQGTSTRINASSGTYIYAAFAENPFKYANAR